MYDNLDDNQLEIDDIFYRGPFDVESNKTKLKKSKTNILIVVAIMTIIIAFLIEAIIFIVYNANKINDLKNQFDDFKKLHFEYIHTSSKTMNNLTNFITDLNKGIKDINNNKNNIKNSENNKNAKIIKNVLLITDCYTNKPNSAMYITTEYLYLLLSKVNFITLEYINSSSVQNYSLIDFIKYSAVVFDLVDGGYGIKNSKFYETIDDYVVSGGSLFVTHDQFDLEEEGREHHLDMLGLEYFPIISNFVTQAKVINKNHSIFSNYYNLTNLDIFTIKETHRSWSLFNEAKNATKLIDLVDDDKQNADYLIVNNYGKGKTAITRAGHSSNIYYLNKDFCELPKSPMTLDEEKIFINTLYWLLFDDK